MGAPEAGLSTMAKLDWRKARPRKPTEPAFPRDREKAEAWQRLAWQPIQQRRPAKAAAHASDARRAAEMIRCRYCDHGPLKAGARYCGRYCRDQDAAGRSDPPFDIEP